MNIYVSLLSVLLLTACADGPYEMTEWTDSHMEQSFIQKLEKENIPFSKDGKKISHPFSEREKIEKIFKAVVDEYSYNIKYKEESMHKKAMVELSNAGISYKIIPTDNGPAISWPKAQNKKAMRVAKSVYE